MTSRAFTLFAAGLALALAGLLAAFNFVQDEFGLFGVRKGPIRIWGYERASKLLLAQRYVPENYEGLLLGSSSADVMMDTSLIRGYAVYNLAINGGNIAEVGRVATPALERGNMRFLVLALSPYLTKDARMKTLELEPGLTRATLGSLFTVRFYQAKLRAVLHPDVDPYRDSWSGFQRGLPPPEPGQGGGVRERPLSTASPVAPEAQRALVDLLNLARSRGVRVLAYFHPLLHPQTRGGYPATFVSHMQTLFTREDVLWDFNDPVYAAINDDESNFLDGAHLSEKGARLVLAEIAARLDREVGRRGKVSLGGTACE